MTAVANPPSFQQINRSAWGSSQGGMNADSDVARMFMPRKSAQRSNSSSSIASSSSSSSTTTIAQPTPQTNGVSMPMTGDLSAWGTQGAAKRKPQRAGPWPTSKAEAMSGVSTARPQSILTPNGTSAASSMSSIHQPAPMVPSQHLQNPGTQQTNGNRGAAQPVGEGNPVLYLLSMNGTFERKTISVPYYPDSIRIGRQTNVKTLPTPTNGFFDSKVLSRQHAEIWADRNGKVWIRDVKSSNGTFVNGARLSPENRDSEPHELQSQDHLELGIDIVSEDQKTVVHHKVAAKVEHAGFLGTTNNVMDMNFGDLDPANGTMMLPSQSGMPFRGRSGSQGSVQSNGRIIPAGSLAGSQMTGMSQPRPMNFWLTPVTTEQIVKRLTHEMRTARLQTSDLGRTDGFIASILSKDEIKVNDKPAAVDPVKPPQLNGTSLPFRVDPKPRFSDPPAPPPQQPLPEKPDSARSQVATDPSSPASLKRSTTERPRSVPNGSPQRQEPTSQIITLVEALASAKKELDSQSARMRDLEEMLQKERQARETAEETARKFELQTSDLKTNGYSKRGVVSSVLEEAFEPPSEILETPEEQQNGNLIDAQAMTDSASLLEKQLEAMMVDMEQMKQQMETFKTRAETAEAERDEDRKTLAEMVQKIRLEETARRSTSTERGPSPSIDSIQNHESGSEALLGPLLHKNGLSNGAAIGSGGGRSATGTLARPPGGPDPLMYQSAPYASILGVVLIGMGLMAYLNGWQPPKVDR